VPPAHEHEGEASAASVPPRSALVGPVRPEAVDRLLEDSADVDKAAASAPIRSWRDDLVLARSTLHYAAGVLATDVALLRHGLSGGIGGATDADGAQSLLDVLPRVVSSTEDGTPADGEGSEPALDAEVIERADPLLSAHEAMARVDLGSPDDVARVLLAVEQELSSVRTRLDAVEARLAEVRAVIVRRYREGMLPSLDQPA
jgi:hypothetical protein